MHIRWSSIGCVALAAGVLASCGSAGNTGLFDVGAKSTSVTASSSAPGATTPAADTGDATLTPAPGWHLWVTVRQVRVRLAKNHWHTVFTGSRKLDLFDTAGIEVPLGSTVLPAGTITGLRLVLAGQPELVTAAGEQPVRCPSCAQSGIKLQPASDITLEPADHVHASLLFDSRHSLLSTPRGDFVLHPVIRVTLSRVTQSA